MAPFSDTICDERALRELYGEGTQVSRDKEIDHLDAHCRAFIAHAPFVTIATASVAGACDASPRGGEPGWVRVLDDHRLLLPDDRGNRRLDSLRNIVATGQIGLLFLVPGRCETLRVNGQAWVTTEADVLAAARLNGKVPPAGIGVRVQTAFMQCGKALIRSQLWQPGRWPSLDDLPTAAEMLRDHVANGVTAPEMDEHLRESYTDRLTW